MDTIDAAEAGAVVCAPSAVVLLSCKAGKIIRWRWPFVITAALGALLLAWGRLLIAVQASASV